MGDRGSRRTWISNGITCTAGWDLYRSAFFVRSETPQEDGQTVSISEDYLKQINFVLPWFSERGVKTFPYELMGQLFDDRRDNRTVARNYGVVDESFPHDGRYSLLKETLRAVVVTPGMAGLQHFNHLFALIEAQHANPSVIVKHLCQQALRDGLTLFVSEEIQKVYSTERDGASRRHIKQPRVGDV